LYRQVVNKRRRLVDLDLRIDAATTSFTTCADRFVKGGYKPSLPFPR